MKLKAGQDVTESKIYWFSTLLGESVDDNYFKIYSLISAVAGVTDKYFGSIDEMDLNSRRQRNRHYKATNKWKVY